MNQKTSPSILFRALRGGIGVLIAKRGPFGAWLGFAALCCMVPALSAATSGNFNYTDNGTYITITGSPLSVSGAVAIPSTINGKPVTTIGPSAFYFCSGLTSVTIPSSVTSIGSYAFSNCSGLASILVDAANPSYSSSDGVLFNKLQTSLIRCPGGKSGAYTIPSGVTSIGASAFDSCSVLTTVTFPAGVTSIGNGAFAYCSGLTSASFMGNAPTLGFSVFAAVASGFKVYYLNGSSGFTSPTWQGYPAQGIQGTQTAQTITFGVLSGRTYGTAPFTVSATASSGLAPTFSIVSGPATVSGNTVTITGVGTVVVRAAQAGNANYLAASTVDQSFTVVQAAQTITFGTLSDKTYGTAPFTVSATASSGLSLTFSIVSGPATVSGNTVTITGLGTVIVRAAQTGDANYTAATSVDRSFIVTNGVQTITFGSLSGKFYGDAPFIVSATASSGLSPTFSIVSGPATISGNTVTITGVGTVVVRASQPGDSNYAAATSVDRSFTVAKAAQTITFDALPAKAYSATPFTLSASTSSGLTPVFTIVSGPATISGNTVTITGVGTVVVRAAQVGDANYIAATPAERSFTVTKGAQTITFDTLSGKSYGDTPFAVSATASSGLAPIFTIVSGPATVSGSTVTIKGVGTVVVRAAQAGNTNYAAATPVNQSFTVSKGTATVTLGGLSQTYTGTARPATATTTPTGLTVTFTYNGGATAPVNAGSYAVVGAISNSLLYQGSASGTLVIGQAVQTITFAALPAKAYTPTPFAVSATASSRLAPTFSIVSGPATISGNMITLTGGGTVVVRASQDGNANYAAATPVDQSFTVTKSTATVTLGSLSQAYTGAARSATATTTPAGLMVTFTYTGSATAPINAGSYAVVGTINSLLYQGSASGTLVVSKAAQTITFGALSAKTYGDAPFTVSATASSGLAPTISIVSGPATISGNTVTLTGAGTVIVRAAQAGDTNYAAATSVDRSFIVAKPAQTITFDPLSAKTYGNAPFTVSATASSGLTPVFSIVSGPAMVLGSTVTIKGVGTVVVRAAQAGNTNYAAATPVNQSFTVSKGTATVTLGGLSQSYTGTARPATATTTPTGLAVTFTYDGSATAPINMGNYAVVGTINSLLYQGSANGTLVVGKAAQTITFAAPPAKTYSATPFAVSATASSKLAPTFSIVSGPATISGNMITLTGGGTVVVRASQDGNGNYAAATPVDRSFTVAKIAQTITFAPPATALMKASPLTLTATASSKLPVTLSIVSGPATLGVDGKTLTLTGAGTVVVQAVQAGNDGYLAAPTLLKTIKVSQVAQTITFTLPATAALKTLPLTLTATASSGLPVTYTVVSGPATIDVDGKTLTVASAGTVVVKATQAGDPVYLAAPAVQKTITVTQTAQTITFTLPTTALMSASPFTLTATASSGLPVTFTVVSGFATLGVDGQTLTVTAAGAVVVKATQTGNAFYSAAPAVQKTITVSQATQVITFTLPTTATMNASPLALTATSSAGLPVSFAVVSGLATIGPDGQSLVLTGVGTVSVRASQAGNINVKAALPVVKTIKITAAVVAKSLASKSIAAPAISLAGNNQAVLVGTEASSSPGLPVGTLELNLDPSAGGYTAILTLADEAAPLFISGTVEVSGSADNPVFTGSWSDTTGASGYAVQFAVSGDGVVASVGKAGQIIAETGAGVVAY